MGPYEGRMLDALWKAWAHMRGGCWMPFGRHGPIAGKDVGCPSKGMGPYEGRMLDALWKAWAHVREGCWMPFGRHGPILGTLPNAWAHIRGGCWMPFQRHGPIAGEDVGCPSKGMGPYQGRMLDTLWKAWANFRG